MLEEERVKVASFPNFDKKRRLKTPSRSSLGMEKGGETKKTFQGGRVIPEKGEPEEKRAFGKEKTICLDKYTGKHTNSKVE